MPTVTIVTPSFNQGEFIRATIESVLAQDYPRVEYIVMDGRSTDHTAAVVSEYASRLTWISEKDRGQAHAINKGFTGAKGEIVAWLNSDDILLPGAITKAVDAFSSAPKQVGAIYGEGYVMDREGRLVHRFPATGPFNLWKLVYLSDYILQQSTFFRRAAVQDVGWLDESLHYALDWDLLIRLGKRFGLYYVPEYFGVLREYPEAKSFSGGRARIEEIRRVLERHTGQERAPGYWVYSLHARRSEWRASARGGPRWLRVVASFRYLLLYLATTRPLMFIEEHAQGIYNDGWAADRLKWMLPEGTEGVIVRGRVPPDLGLTGQTLAVNSRGCELGRWPVGPGPFELFFPAPANQKGPLLFEVHASRYRRSRRISRASFRRIAWVVEAIEWTARMHTDL
jgi:glycosyltransferase involved in cell wall biosynthesis